MNNYCQCKYSGACYLYLPLALPAPLNSAGTLQFWSSSTVSRSPFRHFSPHLTPLGSLRALAVCPHVLILHYILLYCTLVLPPGNVRIIYIDSNDPKSPGSCNYVPFHLHWAIHTLVTVHFTNLSNLWNAYFTGMLEDNEIMFVKVLCKPLGMIQIEDFIALVLCLREQGWQ